jgi:acetyl esterase/lipase
MRFRNRLVKKLLANQLAGWSSGSVVEQRAKQEKSDRFIKLPADIKRQSISANGVTAEWMTASKANVGVVLYLHGGAYALGVTDAHRVMAAQLARTANVRVLMLDYRLAPEHPYPAALEDVLLAYRWLLNQGIDAGQIVIGGDSAGGGLTLAALLALRDAAEPLPAGAVCISPWMDLALTGSSIQNKAKADPILDGDSLKMYARYYAGDNALTTPLISPLYADLRRLPPLLIHVGTEEVLLDDATRFSNRVTEAGGTVMLKIWDEMFHVFHLLPFLPETKKAIQQMAQFVTDTLALR